MDFDGLIELALRSKQRELEVRQSDIQARQDEINVYAIILVLGGTVGVTNYVSLIKTIKDEIMELKRFEEAILNEINLLEKSLSLSQGEKNEIMLRVQQFAS